MACARLSLTTIYTTANDLKQYVRTRHCHAATSSMHAKAARAPASAHQMRHTMHMTSGLDLTIV